MRRQNNAIARAVFILFSVKRWVKRLPSSSERSEIASLKCLSRSKVAVYTFLFLGTVREYVGQISISALLWLILCLP